MDRGLSRISWSFPGKSLHNYQSVLSVRTIMSQDQIFSEIKTNVEKFCFHDFVGVRTYTHVCIVI